ncbi:phosphoglycerate mutase-like protein [Aaosphaeria arxii CBS 175.79]|uniref:Phosphoglycerate mutase-like protein n=1 Tax=Aaosphaeria arxii CBS 175.79 TaxID=1450172 RepID=A0A6A5Y9G0_9PLEO|nr:phosphoglycerate mutase-like protein [Aaosphaeria arxii CBS 175.79]KAF2022222.1 phosphoglycerate mutase-like protein [Aaosphaeria arxii CBS 175.79]
MRSVSCAVFGAAVVSTAAGAAIESHGGEVKVDLNWHAPKKTWVNDLSRVIGDRGTNGFYFGGSNLPPKTKYGKYNWCNMPHVRKQEYPKAKKDYELQYVEVIHRHHKRTPYSSNTFPKEAYPWDCNDQGLFYYGEPLNPSGNSSAHTYWTVTTSSVNPFSAPGFQGSCQFPQITREGLDDSYQHGSDLYSVYHDLLGFLPSKLDPKKVTYRVTNNQITSQVAGMIVNGMYQTRHSNDLNVPLLIQPQKVDSLEPQYSCAAASTLSSSYGVNSKNANWTSHLTAASALFQTLDRISGVPADDGEFHKSFDHYYDNLSARQCHGKPLPCSLANPRDCVNQDTADAVYRLGQWEYSYLYRDAPESLAYSVGAYGVWLAELAQNIRDAVNGGVVYRHNVAHDGSVSRLLSILQVEEMVWVGMGSEVVFEVYTKKGKKEQGKRYLRILWGGQVLRSSNPSLGKVDMIDVEVFLAYIDGLVGQKAGKVVSYCKDGK